MAYSRDNRWGDRGREKCGIDKLKGALTGKARKVEERGTLKLVKESWWPHSLII